LFIDLLICNLKSIYKFVFATKSDKLTLCVLQKKKTAKN